MKGARLGGLGPMLGKEVREVVRTGRLAVALVAYLLVGLGSPLSAKALPLILDLVPPEQMGGMEILLTQDPTATDALVQYAKNFQVLPVLAVLLVMGTVSGERARNITPMLLSRPLSRHAYLVAKILVAGALHTSGTLLAAAGCALYTGILFHPVDPAGFLALNGLLLLFLGSTVAVTILGSTALRSTGAAAGLGFVYYAACVALAALPSLGRWSPAGLLATASDLVAGRVPEAPIAGVAIASGVALAALALADRILARREV
ncbi:MAG: ABC transporter permease subunit [Deltaproteobacteria bacterium]|nr:ABC transporter permease subunit [Deltaproteobacteria bacterium]